MEKRLAEQKTWSQSKLCDHVSGGFVLDIFVYQSSFTKFKLVVMKQYFHTILRTCLQVYYEAIRVPKH